MTSYDLTPLFRTTVGFDRLARILDGLPDNVEKSAGFPPYNIMSDGEDKYRIAMALAGFSADMIDMEVDGNVLTISGSFQGEHDSFTILHQGIAERDFVRKFRLDDHVVVADARLVNGMLTVDLVREVPEEMKPKKIAITTAEPQTLLGKAKKLIDSDSAKAA